MSFFERKKTLLKVFTDSAVSYMDGQAELASCLRQFLWRHFSVTLTLFCYRKNNFTLCLKKAYSDIFDCNLKTNYQILIIFDKNISDIACHQMTV